VKKLISQTIEKFGKLDFLVNNGGGQFMSHTADITLKGWNAVVETNLMGTFVMCRE
ncbi:peroxisomal trans-2-enoyl-CoA reductase, partial [Elysia marginata]